MGALFLDFALFLDGALRYVNLKELVRKVLAPMGLSSLNAINKRRPLLFGGLMGSAIVLVMVIAVLLIRVWSLPAPADPNAAPVSVDSVMANQAAAHLSEAIRFQTISWGQEHPEKAAPSKAAMLAFHDFLQTTYPAFHGVAARRVIAEQSLIYRWPARQGDDAATGANLDARPRPVAFAAHMDVVPINAGTADQWSYPPFDGVIAEGAVWGRGALDDKGSLIALMEAAERLIASGFQPSRDIYFLFGYDEEVLGTVGAVAVTETLKREGVQFEWILDEGSATVKDVLPGVAGAAALISVAEKGNLNLELTVSHEGGHSSAPGAETAVSILAGAVARIAQNPPAQKIDGALAGLLTALAPEAPFAQRVALANLWLSGGLLKGTLAKTPSMAAMMGTTTAPTVLRAGSKANVLPQKARAVVNFRLHPRDNVADFKERIVCLIDDPRVEIRAFHVREPSKISATDGPGYRAVQGAVRATYGDILIAPSMTIAGTDLYHYAKLADDAYRYMPFVMTPSDIARIHGDDEKIEIENLGRGVMFYQTLFRGL